MSSKVLLDPTSESAPAERQRIARPANLDGLTVGLLDISKPRATVRRYRKPTFAKPAPVDLRHEIAGQCHVVIEALAD